MKWLVNHFRTDNLSCDFKQIVLGNFRRDTLNYTVKFRGIYTVGWKYRRKTPNTVG
jgi:hypothetical protein